MSSLIDDTARQLWGGAIDSGSYRLARDGEGQVLPGWHHVRSLTAIGTASRPALLVERGSSRALARSLLAYRRLRAPGPQAARLALATTISLGVPLPGGTIALLKRADADARTAEPLTVIEGLIGQPFLTHVGVRRGANAKATAQLFTLRGAPLGYAKIAWNHLTSGYVQTEGRRLRQLAGRAGNFSTPQPSILATSFDMPLVVTTPLPSSAARLTHPDELTVGDHCSIAPITRIAPPGTSRQHLRLVERMESRRNQPVLSTVTEPVLELARRLTACPAELPIAAYDHGDLVPWNASRDEAGTLWLWDWESSEDDVIAGTDVIHWFVHSVHGQAPDDLPTAVADAADRARTVHRALGMGIRESRVAGAGYVLNSAERACSLAEAHGSWTRNRVNETTVLALCRLGHRLMDQASNR